MKKIIIVIGLSFMAGVSAHSESWQGKIEKKDAKDCDGANPCYQVCTFDAGGDASGHAGCAVCSSGFTQNNYNEISGKLKFLNSVSSWGCAPGEDGFNPNTTLDKLMQSSCKTATKRIDKLRKELSSLEELSTQYSCTGSQSAQGQPASK